MAVVARVLPRHWDGRRLLRFLAGLAMLALAFTTPAEPITAPTPVAITAAAQSPAASPATAPVESAPAAAVRHPSAPPAGPTGVLAATATLLLAGLAMRVRAERAPPACR